MLSASILTICLYIGLNTNLNQIFLFFNCSSSSYSVFIQCCPLSRDSQIHPIPSAIVCTSSLHFARFRASSFFKPIFSVPSSTCFFQVFFSRPCFLLPLTSRSRATLKTLLSSPQHMSIHSLLLTGLFFSSTPACPSVLQSSFCQQLSDRSWLSP